MGRTKLEDDFHLNKAEGELILAVRKDVVIALAEDGQYIPLTTDENGNLRIAGGASESVIGIVGGSTGLIEVALTGFSGTLATGEVIVDTEEVANAVRIDAGTGVLHSIVLLDKADQGIALDVVILRSLESLGTEGGAVDITDTEAEEIIAVVSIVASDYKDFIASQIAIKENIGIDVQAEAGSTSLYVGLIARGAPTYNASDLVIKLGFLQD